MCCFVTREVEMIGDGGEWGMTWRGGTWQTWLKWGKAR